MMLPHWLSVILIMIGAFQAGQWVQRLALMAWGKLSAMKRPQLTWRKIRRAAAWFNLREKPTPSLRLVAKDEKSNWP